MASTAFVDASLLAAATPPSSVGSSQLVGSGDVFYTYTFYDSSGDIYTGYGVADAADGYYEGFTQDAFGGGPATTIFYGTYEITGVYDLSYDLGAQDLIFVESYYDASTGVLAPAVTSGVGYGGLGSERGAVWGDSFGFSGRLQAYVPEVSIQPVPSIPPIDRSSFDVVYTYTFSDSGGDIYTGYGIADRDDGLYVGYTEDVFDGGAAWVAFYGTYEVTGVYNLNGDFGGEGLIFVDGYYDASNRLYSDNVLTGIGTEGFGSEFGLVNGDSFGFAGQLEAVVFPQPVPYAGLAE